MTTSGSVAFRCTSCNIVIDGKPEDAIIYKRKNDNTETLGRYNNIIENSPFDPVNKRVHKQCECGRDYVVQLRLSNAEVIVLKCKCGKELIQ
jgi:hypothetical protein